MNCGSSISDGQTFTRLQSGIIVLGILENLYSLSLREGKLWKVSGKYIAINVLT